MDYVSSHGEWRDTIDQRISQLIESLGGVPIAMPNNLQSPDMFIDKIRPDLFILTGGNTVSSMLYDKEGTRERTYVRDETEYVLLKYASNHRVPLLGICRGFQMMNVFWGGSLKSCSGHIGTRHRIKVYELECEINSYHEQGIYKEQLAPKFIPIATAEDNVIEAAKHKELPMIGIQWHPERENSLQEVDRLILSELMK